MEKKRILKLSTQSDGMLTKREGLSVVKTITKGALGERRTCERVSEGVEQ